MTAEVGVMNRIGVALAADSAVTIGQDAEKIYTSADKLFHLSTIAPVGIMVYGNANFVGIPWETIIKSYRRKLGDTAFDTVSNYSEDFFDFLCCNQELFPNDRQDHHIHRLVLDLYLQVREIIRIALNQEAEAQDGLDPEDIPPILSRTVKQILENIKKVPNLQNFDAEARETIRKRYGPEFRRMKRQIFSNLPLSSGVSRQLSSIALEMLTREWLGASRGGIVIAGFGQKEYMPTLISYELEEMLLSRPRFVERTRQTITDDNQSAIVPFAQREMVHVFMEGIDRDLSEFMRSSTEKLIFGVVTVLLEKITQGDSKLVSKLQAALTPEIRPLLDKLYEEWKMRQNAHWQPVIEVVASLPKDELAAMAEALVNLTKFRRRVTTDRETVGGPIDVAVITKGDGFIWIRRKHYFEPELNPRAIARYGREGA